VGVGVGLELAESCCQGTALLLVTVMLLSRMEAPSEACSQQRGCLQNSTAALFSLVQPWGSVVATPVCFCACVLADSRPAGLLTYAVLRCVVLLLRPICAGAGSGTPSSRPTMLPRCG
jgi:hypothetical protein